MTQFKKITLDNGLRIILVPKQDSLATTVLVLVEAGSKYEKKEMNGLSHFLEHMCFKGTKKRPRSIDIASELAGIGASSNAFTSLEYTGYFAKSEPKHFETILDVVSDIYLNPVLDPNEIQKERGVIIEEMNMILDTPMRYIGDLWLTLLYGDQPAGWDIVGSKEVVLKLSRDDFLQYRSEHYLAGSTIVVVAGKFNEEEVVPAIKKNVHIFRINVHYRGYDVGDVTDLKLSQDQKHINFYVTINYKGLRLPTNSKIKFKTENIYGVRYLDVEYPEKPSGKFLKNGDIVDGAEAYERIDEYLIESISALVSFIRRRPIRQTFAF